MEDAEDEVANLDEDDGMEEEDEEQARQIAHAIEIVEGEDQVNVFSVGLNCLYKTMS